MVGKTSAADPRTTYGSLVVEINPDFPPLTERIELQVHIDQDLIAHAKAVAGDRKIAASAEYYDLEFSLQVSSRPGVESHAKKQVKVTLPHNKGKQLLVRANVTNNALGWPMVPGELLREFNAKNIYERKEFTAFQKEEDARYQPCSSCGAVWSGGCCVSPTTY
jgi:molecular chaperone DnaK